MFFSSPRCSDRTLVPLLLDRGGPAVSYVGLGSLDVVVDFVQGLVVVILELHGERLGRVLPTLPSPLVLFTL